MSNYPVIDELLPLKMSSSRLSLKFANDVAVAAAFGVRFPPQSSVYSAPLPATRPPTAARKTF